MVAGIAVLATALAPASAVLAQSPSPSAGAAGQAGVITLGADRELFQDDLKPVRRWGLKDTRTARIEAEDGGLRFRLEGTDHIDWSWHSVPESVPVLRATTSLTIDTGQGEAGPMCGAAGDEDTFFMGVLSTTGDWFLGRIVDSAVTWTDQGPLPQPAAEDVPVEVALECAVTGEGGDRLALFVDGVNVADITDAETLGPFDKVGLVAGITRDRFRALFDDVVVLGGDAYAPQVTIGEGPEPSPGSSVEPSPLPSGEAVPQPSAVASPAPVPSIAAPTPLPVGALVGAIPAAFQADCRTFEPDAASGQLEAVLCVPAGGAETAEYYRYDSVESLQAAFIRLVPPDGVATGDDCTVGPAMVEFTVGGRTAGTLACYDDPRGGITVQWADDDLLVLAFGTLRDGSYADAYTWWQDAGPLP